MIRLAGSTENEKRRRGKGGGEEKLGWFGGGVGVTVVWKGRKKGMEGDWMVCSKRKVVDRIRGCRFKLVKVETTFLYDWKDGMSKL